MSPLLVLLPRIGYLHNFGIKIAKIVRWNSQYYIKNMDMVEIFLKSPNVRESTLHPSETLLFSGLPMMIWQKKIQRIVLNQLQKRAKKILSNCWSNLLCSPISRIFPITFKNWRLQNLQINLEGKRMDESFSKKYVYYQSYLYFLQD